MNNQNATTLEQDDDALSFWDIVDILKEGWSWLGGGLLLGLAFAVVYLVVTPKQYEATVLFQGAKVLGAEVESAANLIERLKFPTFYQDDEVKACGSASSDAALTKQVSPSLVKGTSILQLKYRADDKAKAVQCLDAVVGLIISSHTNMSAKLLENAKRLLEYTKAQLAESERLQSVLEKRSMGSLDAADTKFSQSVLLMSVALSKKDQIAGLRKSVLEQTVNLEPPATRPPELIEPIYVTENSVFPKTFSALAGGSLGGLIFGGLVFFVRRSWLTRK